MLPNIISDTYPRKLSELGKIYLRKLLPVDRSGYRYYNQKLDKLFVIGEGRFQQQDYVLGEENDTPDFTVPAEAMLAVGTIRTPTHKIEISIHFEFENKIEIDFAVSGESKFNDTIHSYWTYSEWLPGEKSPPDQSFVREVHLINNKVVIALAPDSKRVWIYEAETGMNHLIPATNFYNEIMRIKNVRDPKIALKPQRLFTNLDELKDEDITQGFLMYNKYLNKIKIDYSLFSKTREVKKSSVFNIFGGSKN